MTQLIWISNSTCYATYRGYILGVKLISQSMLKKLKELGRTCSQTGGHHNDLKRPFFYKRAQKMNYQKQMNFTNTGSYIRWTYTQYIPRNMHTDFALLCFVVVIHWLIFQYPSGLLYWHCGNLTIAPVPAKQPWWIWINTSCEFIMNDCLTTTKQSTTKPCAYFLGYTVFDIHNTLCCYMQPAV